MQPEEQWFYVRTVQYDTCEHLLGLVARTKSMIFNGQKKKYWPTRATPWESNLSVRRSFPGNSEPFLSVPGNRNKDTWTRKTEDSNRMKRIYTSFILGLDTTPSSSFFSQVFEYKYSFSSRSRLFLSNFGTI